MQHTPIKALGSFFPMDSLGHVINPASLELIPAKWRPLLRQVVDTCLHEQGADLHSIYLRGSVPRGLAADSLADLDLFLLVRQSGIRWQTADWLPDYQARWQAEFTFVKNIEVMCASYSKKLLATNPHLAMITQTQSVCLHGISVIPDLPRFKPGQQMMLNYRWLEDDLKQFLAIASPTHEAIREIAKITIRCGFEIVMQRIGKYTTDLYLCYQSFARYYPRKAAKMEQLLFCYLNPGTVSVKELHLLLNELADCILPEIRRYIL